MKRLTLLLTALILASCSSKKVSYLLPSANNITINKTKVQIGVKKIKVPSYLDSDKILIKDGIKLKELDANFAASPDKLLTQKAIDTLKKSLNDPNVFLYPWDVDKKRGYIVDIRVDDFVYSNGYVNLSGSYYIKLANGNTIVSKNFNLSKPSSNKADDIVNNLGELFDEVIIDIAKKIAK